MAAKILFLYPNLNGIRRIPLGISILSSCLKKAGHLVELFDTTFYKQFDEENTRREKLGIVKIVDTSPYYKHVESNDVREGFIQAVKSFTPDIIGISLLQDDYHYTRHIINGIKKITDSFVIAGGVMPTLAPENVLRDLDVDAVMIGEGETAFVELVNEISSGKDPYSVSNLAYRKNGKIKKNQLALIVPMHTLPPHDYTIFNQEHLWRPFVGEMWKTGILELTRGCPYNCTFCANPNLNALYKGRGRIRTRNIDTFIDEAANLKKTYGLNLVAFNDENFLFLKELEEFAKKWTKNIGLPFMAQTRIETIERKKLEILKDAGCVTLMIGIESGDEEYRRKMLSRKYSNDDVVRVFRECREVGIRTTANNIIGYPYETEEHIKKTIELNRLCRSESITIAIFAPYLGCDLYELCIRDGLVVEGIPEVPIPTYKSCLKFPEEHHRMIEFYFNNFQNLVYSDKEIVHLNLP